MASFSAAFWNGMDGVYGELIWRGYFSFDLHLSPVSTLGLTVWGYILGVSDRLQIHYDRQQNETNYIISASS